MLLINAFTHLGYLFSPYVFYWTHLQVGSHKTDPSGTMRDDQILPCAGVAQTCRTLEKNITFQGYDKLFTCATLKLKPSNSFPHATDTAVKI